MVSSRKCISLACVACEQDLPPPPRLCISFKSRSVASRTRSGREAAFDPGCGCSHLACILIVPGYRDNRNSNPEDRRVTPEDENGRKKFKVVYVVLESQYQSSMTVACKRINAAQVSSSWGATIRKCEILYERSRKADVDA